MTFDEAMAFQAAFCDTNGAPVTAAACRALAAGLDRTTATGRRVHDWTGDYIRDALPLRLVAPYHALLRRGDIAAFDTVEAIRAATVVHDDWICEWLDGPPQTNEPARSATFMAALLVLSERFGLPFELLEIGSSAGLNLLIDRYRYDLGGSMAGPEGSPVLIRPEWRGTQPPQAKVRIASVRGVDIAPIDVTDAQTAARLMAYVWIDAPERTARVKAAIAMIGENPVDLVQGDAVDWVEARLEEQQESGICRVLMHSIVWQYLPSDTQKRIRTAMDNAGAAATVAKPLGWIRMEPDAERKTIELHVEAWPSFPETRLAGVHPHGAWIEWSA